MAEQEDLSAFFPIHVASLRGDLKLPCDVFVRVAGKSILYCRQGDSFEGSRLERLRNKKLDKMYIRVGDERAYRQYFENSIEQAYDAKSEKPLEIRAEVIQGFHQATTERFMENPSSQNAYDAVRSSAVRFNEFIEREPLAMNYLLALKNSDQNVAHHGFNVAALSLQLIREQSPNDVIHLPVVAVGCFLHDIDHFENGLKRSVPVEELPKPEREKYLQHPANGASILQGKGFVDALVYKIISQHEENAQGSGFPRGMTSSQIDPLVLFVATANAYDRLISFEKMTPKEAMKKLTLEKLGLYPLEYLQALGGILKRAGTL